MDLHPSPSRADVGYGITLSGGFYPPSPSASDLPHDMGSDTYPLADNEDPLESMSANSAVLPFQGMGFIKRHAQLPQFPQLPNIFPSFSVPSLSSISSSISSTISSTLSSSSSSSSPSLCKWEPYLLPDRRYVPLYRSSPVQQAELKPHTDYSIYLSSIQSIARSFLENEQVWMVHRQSSFKVSAAMQGPLMDLLAAIERHSPAADGINEDGDTKLCVLDTVTDDKGIHRSVLRQISSLSLVINAVRETPATSQTVQSQHQPYLIDDALLVQKSSSKAPKIAPPPIQMFPNTSALALAGPSNGASTLLGSTSRTITPSMQWNKLQFTMATAGNGKARDQQEYFRLVVSLVAHTNADTRDGNSGVPESFGADNEKVNRVPWMLCSVIAPSMVVIGQNPARYKRAKLKHQLHAQPPPQPPAHPTLTLALPIAPHVHSTPSPPHYSSPSDISSPTASPDQSPHPHHPHMGQSAASIADKIYASQMPSHSYDGTSSPRSDPRCFAPHLQDHQEPFLFSSSYPSSSTSSPINMPKSCMLGQGGQANCTWTTNADGSVYRYGNVGVNVFAPSEALTVGGNVLMSGDLMKPSDMRIKRNMQPLQDTRQHLENIQRLKMYDYERFDLGADGRTVEGDRYVPERGFLAQEVREVLPAAVKVVGDVQLPNGMVVHDMLVVNDRVLLLENIGATQELGKALETVGRNTTENSRIVERLVGMVDAVVDSELKKDHKEDRRLLYQCFNSHGIFNLGPAWTLTIVGFFFPPLWLLGMWYMCSRRSMRQLSGVLSIVLFSVVAVAYIVPAVLLTDNATRQMLVFTLYAGFWAIGLIICISVVITLITRKTRKRNHERQLQKKSLASAVINASETTPETTPIVRQDAPPAPAGAPEDPPPENKDEHTVEIVNDADDDNESIL